MSERGRRHTVHTTWIRVEGKQAEDTKKDNIAQIYTDTKQDMELCENSDQKHSLDCRGNPGHKQC